MLPDTEFAGKVWYRNVQNRSAFWHNEEGVTGLDLAFLCPIILVLSFSTIDLGRLFITEGLLRSSLTLLAATSRYTEGNLTSDELEDRLFRIAQNRAAGWIDRDMLTLSVQPVSEGEIRVSFYRVQYKMTAVTPLAEALLGAGVFRRVIHLLDHQFP